MGHGPKDWLSHGRGSVGWGPALPYGRGSVGWGPAPLRSRFGRRYGTQKTSPKFAWSGDILKSAETRTGGSGGADHIEPPAFRWNFLSYTGSLCAVARASYCAGSG